MSGAIGIFDRIRFTPMRDVLRGRLTARLDVSRHIEVEAADLPAPARELTQRVVRRTRLRSWEKLDVADDLIAHFADGLAAGETVEQLIDTFGDERVAAKLIARAKRRARSVAAWAAIALRYAPLVLALFYAAIAARFFAGKPALEPPPTTAVASATTDAAMPLYKRASERLGWRRRDTNWRGLPMHFSVSRDDLWLEQYLNERADAIELVHQAADKAVLGAAPGDADAPAMLRQLAWPLGYDAQAGAARGDRERLMRDLRTTFNMSRHARDAAGGTLIAELSAIALRHQLHVLLRHVLENYPAVLNDEDLQELAHLIAGPRTPADLITFAGSRRAFYDAVARAYTSDGGGDGRLTPRGLAMLNKSSDLRHEALRTPPLAPAAMLVAASRRDLSAEYDDVMDAVLNNFRRPRRDTDWTRLERRIEQLRAGRARYPMLGEHLPYVPAALHERAEDLLQQRDGVLVGLALELFRRWHGRYPASLSELSPAFLPVVPLDPVDGRPLRYRLVDGKPLVYSFGRDGDDDGGYEATVTSDDDKVLFGLGPATRPVSQ